MLIALWIVNIVLALVFLASGGKKLVSTREQLSAAGMGSTENFSDVAVKALGMAEVLGAIGLIAPLATGIAPVLTPIAAVALLATMIGAVVVHARRSEALRIPVVFTILTLVSAVLGFAVTL